MSEADGRTRRGFTADAIDWSTPAPDPPASKRTLSPRTRMVFALVVALVAGGALIAGPSHGRRTPPAGRVAAQTAWPGAQRADIPANLPDGPAYQPVLFLDARTSIGTAASPDGTAMRLVLRRPDDSVRQLRRTPIGEDHSFGNFTVTGDDVAWVETTATACQLWTINLRAETPPRLVTADTGDALFYASQYDLVIADNRLHWVSAAPRDANATTIRSVPLTGGPVETRTEPGRWSLSAWPWLIDGISDITGTTRVRNMLTHRDIAVAALGAQTCSPTWCRIVTPTADRTSRIDLMHPDGTGRRRVGGGLASPALQDVAPLDRFEVLSEPTGTSDLTGTARLLVYDLATGHTIDISPDVGNASYGNGVLWWSTGLRDAITWHALDLRTVTG